MSTPKKVTIILVVAILSLVGELIFTHIKSGKYQNTSTSVSQPQNVVKTEAPPGKLINGFPETLKLDPTAQVSESFLITYPKLGQYTANLVSSQNTSAVYKQYSQYLKDNSFVVISSDLKPDSAHLYATKTGVADINVTISAIKNSSTGKNQTNILISYLAK